MSSSDTNSLSDDQVADWLRRQEEEISAFGYSPTVEDLWKIDYDQQPVPIREFIESDEYLGNVTRDLQESWKADLESIFSPESRVVTLILTGAIGTGKTTVAYISALYKLYCLSCLKDPAAFYGLLPGSRIVFGTFNITLHRTDTGYEMVKYWSDQSPYFQKHCPRTKRPDSPILFESKNILWDVGSLDTHALGENMFTFIMDEANFFKRSADPNEKTRAHKLYRQAGMRLVSRFQRYGQIPGLRIVISSKKLQDSFLEEQIALTTKDIDIARTTKVISKPLWEAKDPKIYSGQKFRVAVGDASISSRILEDDELAPGFKVIDVPIELKSHFVADIELALMDLAGESIVGSHSFFTNRESIAAMFRPSRKHPFDTVEISDCGIDIKGGNAQGAELKHHFLTDLMFKTFRSRLVPRLDPNAKRFCHIDIGLTNDALGMSIAHVQKSANDYKIVIDIVLRIVAPPKQEIDLEQIVKFLKYLRECGMSIACVSFDRYESRFIIQQLTKAGFKAGQLSIVEEHYKMYRTLLFERKIDCYDYFPLQREMLELRKGEDGRRPEHPPDGHDDVCDSVCGAIAHCAGIALKKVEKKAPSTDFRAPLFGIGSRT